MKYFIPEWDDRVDPAYNFLTEEHSTSHSSNPFSDSYMWEIFPKDKTPFDGVLVSRAKLEQNKKKLAEIKKVGVRSFLRLPPELPIIADCGAWSYIAEEVPRYDPVEVLDFYSTIGVDRAVTVDHLVVPRFQEQKAKRLKVTFDNGLKGYEAWKDEYRNHFELYVTVQGWDAEDYLRMIENYNKAGIEKFAIGGLARSPTTEVLELIERMENELRNRRIKAAGLHFFGLGRFRLLPHFARLEEIGVDVSFDTASWLRQAWLSGTTNYYSINQKLRGYSAIRVPQADKGRTGLRGSKKLPETTDLAVVKKLENECLSSIRAYDIGQTNLEDVMQKIMRYGKVVPVVRLDRTGEYERALKETPWKKCGCTVCEKSGIEVMIFRGNNRNRRRGFHNVYTIYHEVLKRPEMWTSITEEPIQVSANELTQLTGRVLVIAQCTKKKVGYTRTVKTQAMNLYQGQLFRATRKYAESRSFDYVIISAKYGLLLPDEIVEGYDKVLRTRSDVEEIRESVETKLSKILPNYDTILVVGGKPYRSVLRNLWSDKFVTLKSRGYGDMTHMLANSTLQNAATLTQFIS